MKTITIWTKDRQKTAYYGQFETDANCLETALNDGVSLCNTDLRGLVLAHANLDGGDFSGAVLDGADMTGANLSECNLCGASLRGVDLSLAALCESRLIDVDFTDASFAGTLIDAAVIDACTFTCPSSLHLPFNAALALGSNRFGVHVFSTAPVVITGLPKRIVFLDDVVLIGDTVFPRADFPNPFENLFRNGAKASQYIDEG